ncbi:site-specific integrase [Nocardia sp. alder85J]|uniref:site-specific integrase n=1 Tax=Nocardia sp. alder85J TaxID=2862949 RepID=UPI001CD47CE2|nr:site-specific integrase [Nocardia sp. alder85J]MCX4097923.1 site-specific integrase [Nocardia sp. alder85J]
MTTFAAGRTHEDRRSPFAGADICRQAGLALPEGAHRPLFDDDMWDFTDVAGLAIHIPPSVRRFDFTAIGNPRWRLVAKELIMATLAPRHPAVTEISRAYRIPLHLRSANGRLRELIRFFRWLQQRHLTSLAELDNPTCEAYLAFRRHVLDENGVVVGELSPMVRGSVARTVIDLINYRDLFTTDRVRTDLRPWGGASAASVAEPRGRGANSTPPVPDEMFRPMLAAALHLVQVLGPHAVALNQQVREHDRVHGTKPEQLRPFTAVPVDDILTVLADYTSTGTPLPRTEDHIVAMRLAAGWSAEDPLLPVATGMLARQAGRGEFEFRWMPHLRGPLTEAIGAVGVEKIFARDASHAPAADGTIKPWSLPLHRLEAIAVVGVVRTAAIIVLAASSGMRSSELMELRVGCRRPVTEPVPGLERYRIASKIVKGRPLGGVEDEWVVIEPAFRAAELLEQLHDDPHDGVPLLSRFSFRSRDIKFRSWVNSPPGQRLGLAPIPDGPVSLRMIRRTVALELAYRPGGVLAAKLQLKHIAIATTEGYAARPGGAQAELLAEVNKHEAERNLQLVLTEFHNYRNGVLPAGPGARNLIDFFTSIDTGPGTEPAAAPKVQRNDRDILNLLSKRAETLHLGTANYCWFTDPSRALCLKLAGTPTADRPLIGMCDSARCPQATHHQVHRPVWSQHAETTKTFLGQLGKTRTTERTRLQADHDRALRVITSIDTATTEKKQ